LLQVENPIARFAIKGSQLHFKSAEVFGGSASELGIEVSRLATVTGLETLEK
jgi:hypothetical protein